MAKANRSSRKKHPLYEHVNFNLSVCFLGSAALLGMVMMMEASDYLVNPVANVMISTVFGTQ